MSKMLSMSTSTTPDLLGTVQAAELIGIERSTLTRWSENGRITRAMKLPGKAGTVLFHRSEVERVAAEYAAITSGAAS